jgi:uncharacterized protein (TIGR03118 family)
MTLSVGRSARSAYRRPLLEALEDRMLLSGNNFLQVDLTANVAGVAANTDPNLVNPIGISEGGKGPFWVSDFGTNLSTLYNSAGSRAGLFVSIPGPNGSAGNATASPTGQVNNGDPNVFLIPGAGNNQAAVFIFATEDGTIAAWNPALGVAGPVNAVTVVPDSGNGASFTGLASGTVTSGMTTSTFLYAADFRNGTIDVFNSAFKSVALSSLSAHAFQDAKIPADFSPYNIQDLGGNIYVTYAKVGADGQPVVGEGQGFVDEFSTSGVLKQRFSGHLDAAYGVQIAPAGFGKFGGDLLVANTGTGQISVFNPANGKFVATLNDAAGMPLTIDGLRALQFGNGNGGGLAGVLYFTADPTHGAARGLFGSLTFVSETSLAQFDTAVLQTELAIHAGNPGVEAGLLAMLKLADQALAKDTANNVTLTPAQEAAFTALNNVLTPDTPIIGEAVLHFPQQMLDALFLDLEITALS